MAVTVRQMLVPQNKYNIKCPYKMTPKFLTVHNTYNNAPAENEAKYMVSNNNEVSFHIVFDDKEGIQCIPFDRNAWHAGDGNGSGNRESIGIEICYSKSGGSKFDAAERNAAQWIAAELKRRNWGIDKVKRHYDWSGKNCPHRTMANGWQRFLDMVQSYMDEGKSETSTPVKKPTSAPEVKGRGYAAGKWWGEVSSKTTSGTESYIGVKGQPLRALQLNTVGDASVAGKLKYRLRKLGGGWYNWQIDREKDKNGENFAGDKVGKFDCLQISLEGLSGYTAEYRAYDSKHGWMPWVRGYNNSNSNGYAGWDGYAIECVQVRIVKK